LTEPPSARLAHLRSRTPLMVEALAGLVGVESPSKDLAALTACAAAVAALGTERLGTPPQRIVVDDHPHLRWSFGPPQPPKPPRVVLLAHMDTVWPLGELAARPFAVDVEGDRASGPGALDMKSGIVQLFEALATLADLEGLSVLVTSDEEIGSPTSRALIEETAAGASAALVLEPSAAAGALKTARKGTGMYTLRVHGRAAHAGLEPEKGANALLGLAGLVLRSAELARPEHGTTVVPTVARAGTATNVVPAEASLELDVRIFDIREADRIDAAVRDLTTDVPGTTLSVDGGMNRPPMPAGASEALFKKAQSAAERLGLPPLTGVAVGGASDGNFTAAIGVPTLDGLGGVGEGAHATHEYLVISAMAERAALVGELVEDLLTAR